MIYWGSIQYRGTVGELTRLLFAGAHWAQNTRRGRGIGCTYRLPHRHWKIYLAPIVLAGKIASVLTDSTQHGEPSMTDSQRQRLEYLESIEFLTPFEETELRRLLAMQSAEAAAWYASLDA